MDEQNLPRWTARIARRFHEEYERLAPQFGYETREETAVPWEDVPAENKQLMQAVVNEVFYQTAPFNKGGHGRGCWFRTGGSPCDCTASDGAYFQVREMRP